MNQCTRDTVTEYPCSSGHFHFTTIAKSGKVTLAAPLNDSYVEIMEVHCQLLGCYLDRRQLVVKGRWTSQIARPAAVVESLGGKEVDDTRSTHGAPSS